jgi:hypothetical protein
MNLLFKSSRRFFPSKVTEKDIKIPAIFYPKARELFPVSKFNKNVFFSSLFCYLDSVSLHLKSKNKNLKETSMKLI